MSRRALILGTAGHIDHGKTALVKALTSVDTDRLAEEKARGITIDLGFAEFSPTDDAHMGVVDVPGHEGFVRNMLAGATGMDLVLMVVAADEGVMPQTREHLAIVRLLGVERMVVALTKRDLVDDEWLALATEEVRELLEGTPYQGAPVIPTSATTGEGLAELTEALVEAVHAAKDRRGEDLARLPVDRVFTVRGTGTVVTGTLWSGRLKVGDSVRLLPGGSRARIRGIQVHGREARKAAAGARTAVALVGADVTRESASRGHVLVADDAWHETSMITVRLAVLENTGWAVEHGQRVRAHLGTAEVMARAVALEGRTLGPGETGWVQLRLERPVSARARDHLVVRSYSPVTTIAGGLVAEPNAPKRRGANPELLALLEAVLEGDTAEATLASAALVGWEGVAVAEVPLRTGLDPENSRRGLEALVAAGGRMDGGRAYHPDTVAQARTLVLEAIRHFHDEHPLRPGLPLEELRQRLPARDGNHLADGLLVSLEEGGLLRVEGGVARAADFEPELSDAQRTLYDRLLGIYEEHGIAPPSVPELPDPVRESRDLWPVLKLMEARDDITGLDAELFVATGALREARARVTSRLGGRSGLGPADFKEVLPVTRKHLIPLLAYFDREGITVRSGAGREVAQGEGTPGGSVESKG